MKMLVVLLPLLFLFLGQGSRIHGQIVCQLFRQIFCHSRSSGIVQMIAAILRIGDPVETGWELTVVIVISQVVFLGQLFYRVGLALVPGICGRNGQKHQPDSVSITEIIDFLELIQFLLGWLSNHIIGMDKKIAVYMDEMKK